MMQPVPDDNTLYDDCTWYLAAARGKPAGPRLVTLCQELRRQHDVLITNTDKCIAVFQYGGDNKDLDPTDHCPIEENLITFNAAQNAVETIHAKVCKARITPMPLTNGGGYLQRHRARQMGKAIEGVLDENNADQIEEDVVMDAMVTDHGAGAIKVVERYDCVRLEHVPVEDVWFDQAEIRQRQPRSCYHVPKDGWDVFVALETFANPSDKHPGFVGTPSQRRAAIIKAASRNTTSRASRTGASITRRVDIYESWHLPSGEPEEYEEDEEYQDDEGEVQTRRVKKMRHDGRHVVAVDGEEGTLIDEPWCEDHFPILLYVPRRRRRSIWGLSLMRGLIASQREYEKLTMKIQNQHQKMALCGLSAPKSAEINVRELQAGTFSAGWLLEHEGPNGPIPFVIDPVAQGTYIYADSIPRNMLERHGISTLAATSQLPSGLSDASGKALQVYEDFEDTRLMPYHRERERFTTALSWIIVCAAKRVVDRCGQYKTRYAGRGRVAEPIDWKDVLMDKASFILKVFPIGSLSKQPAAKFAQLTELLNREAITVEQFKRLFEIPDLEAENELDTSDTDIIDRNMDIMVVEGRYLSPEPFDNLDLIVQRAGKFYNLCRQKEVPEDRLQLLRDYMEDAKSLIEQAKPPAPNATPMPGAPGVPPPGPGMEPPAGPLPGMPPLPMAA